MHITWELGHKISEHALVITIEVAEVAVDLWLIPTGYESYVAMRAKWPDDIWEPCVRGQPGKDRGQLILLYAPADATAWQM